MATQTSLLTVPEAFTKHEATPALTTKGANDHKELENGTVDEPVDKFAPLHDQHRVPLTPL